MIRRGPRGRVEPRGRVVPRAPPPAAGRAGRLKRGRCGAAGGGSIESFAVERDWKMPLPVVGVTMDAADRPDKHRLSHGYVDALVRAGALPWCISYRTPIDRIPDLVGRLDGILFTGGDDLDPALYGERWHPRARPIDPQRQAFELALMAEAHRRRTPSLCVCLGCQVLNVYRGGGLIQFLPDHPRQPMLEHRKVGDALPRHRVRIEAGSLLAAVVGAAEIEVNTYHKQAVGAVGKGLRVSARAEDGVVEALEDPAMPWLLAVQWHPERLLDEPPHQRLFDWLVGRCRASAGR